MKARSIGALALILVIGSSEIAEAADLASQLPGVWKRTSIVRKYVDSDQVAKPLGDNPTGVAVFTSGGFFAMTNAADGRKKFAGPEPTDSEAAALYKTAFFGSGTYKIEGGDVVLRYESSLDPSFVGAERRPKMAISGRVLTWTTPQFKDASGKAYNDILTQERVD